MIVDDLIGVGKTLIEKLIPDPQAKEAAYEKLKELEQQGELAQLAADTQLTQGQLDINKLEATNPNLFVSGWRPFIGWVCGVALACYYVPFALVSVSLWAYQCVQAHTILTRPDMGITDLLGLVGTMLGFGLMRSNEKLKGVTT